MRLVLIIILVVIGTGAVAFAQDATNPALLGKALDVIATQRNQALGDAAIWQAKAIILSEELTKAQARIKELETKPEKKDNE